MKMHKVNPPALMVLTAFLTFLPGIDLMNKKRLQQVNFPALLFMVGALCIGSVGATVGTPKWITAVATPYFESTGTFEAVSMAYWGGALLSFILTPLGALAAITAPITVMTSKLGLDPREVIYSLIYGLDQYILPYEYAPFLFIFGTGYISLSKAVKYLLSKAVACYLLLIAIILPYWGLVM